MKSKVFILVICVGLVLSLPTQAGVKYRVLHDFGSGKDGAGPSGPLVFDRKGDLYGATFGGGDGCSGGCGTVFELSPQANGRWSEVIVHSFSGGTGGYMGGIVLDPVGNLYGTMRGYLSYAIGGVYELSSSSNGWNFAVLYNEGTDGGWAGPGVLMDNLGNLYGQMGTGQDHGGAIAELLVNPNQWNYTQLYSFCNQNSCPDGVSLPTPPIWDGHGRLFGVTTNGGIYSPRCSYNTNGCGVIYEMTPNGDGAWTYHVLHRFASFKSDGERPYGGLVMGSGGNFYGGTTGGGAQGLGTVFKLADTGGKWKETILYDFPNCTHGCGVEGTLALDKAGNLYGTGGGGTGSCGPYSCGVVFKLSPQKNGKWKYSVVYNFTAAGGGFQPFYGVIVDDKGNLFGVTSQFGKYGFGTAFEITQ